MPKTLTITSQKVREALQEPISTIVESVRITLERCPPELSADLVDRGIVLAGGGALLRGLDKLLSEETGLPVHVAEDPLGAVAEGTGKCLSEFKFLRQVAASEPPRVAGRGRDGRKWGLHEHEPRAGGGGEIGCAIPIPSRVCLL